MKLCPESVNRAFPLHYIYFVKQNHSQAEKFVLGQKFLLGTLLFARTSIKRTTRRPECIKTFMLIDGAETESKLKELCLS
jgi:hypothetical protein